MSTRCQAGHTLERTPVPVEWKCDACENHSPPGSISYGCRRCDVDACERCVARVCQNKHFLLLSQPEHPWLCDKCGHKGTGPAASCRRCDYDLCMTCSQPATPQPTTHGIAVPLPHATATHHHRPPPSATNYQQQQQHHYADPTSLAPSHHTQHHQATPTAASKPAVMCPAGHHLAVEDVPGDWRCDCCGAGFSRGTKSAGCRRCDLDVCPKCYSGSTCENYHVLLSHPMPSAWSCDMCSRTFSASDTSYGCRTCDFDVCPACFNRGPVDHHATSNSSASASKPHVSSPAAPAKPPTPPPAAAPDPTTKLKCPKSHPLKFTHQDGGWICDCCQTRHSKSEPSFSCRGTMFSRCDIDLCMECAKSGGCTNDHLLVTQAVPGDWVCDRCRKTHSINESSKGCRACDFDICDACFRGGSQQPHAVPNAVPTTAANAATSSSAAHGSGGATNAAFRARLERFYRRYNPSKMGEIDAILAKAHGREQELFEALVSKYGPEPDAHGHVPAAAPSSAGAHQPAASKPHVSSPAAPAKPPTPLPPAAVPDPTTKLKCPKSHLLKFTHQDGGWICDCCRTKHSKSEPSFSCRGTMFSRCDIDLCMECAKSGGCTNDHLLVTQAVPGDWVCDRCRKTHSINESSKGCRACDFDICMKCFKDAAHFTPSPAPAHQHQQHHSPAAPAPSTTQHPTSTVSPTPTPAAAPTASVAAAAAAPAPTRARCKSLFIGINYPGTGAELNGCVNDVVTMQNLVMAHGFSLTPDNCRVLVDASRSYRGKVPVHGQPTKQEILAGLRWLADRARPGDNLFLHYSGHGTRMRDQDGDEADGYDEALVPADYQHRGLIRDDDIFAIVCRDLPRGVRLTCVADCCHSGSIMDLEFEWRWRGEHFAEQPKRRRRAQVLSRDFMAVSKKSTQADVVLFSGCKDTQTSADVSNVHSFQHKYSGPGKAGGACTNAIAEILAHGKSANVSYGKLLELMQANLKRRGFSQVPQLSSSRKVDMHGTFSLFDDLV